LVWGVRLAIASEWLTDRKRMNYWAGRRQWSSPTAALAPLKFTWLPAGLAVSRASYLKCCLATETALNVGRYLAGRVRRRVSERAVHRSTGRPSRQARVMTRRRDYCQQDGRRSLVMVTWSTWSARLTTERRRYKLKHCKRVGNAVNTRYSYDNRCNLSPQLQLQSLIVAATMQIWTSYIVYIVWF